MLMTWPMPWMSSPRDATSVATRQRTSPRAKSRSAVSRSHCGAGREVAVQALTHVAGSVLHCLSTSALYNEDLLLRGYLYPHSAAKSQEGTLTSNWCYGWPEQGRPSNAR